MSLARLAHVVPPRVALLVAPWLVAVAAHAAPTYHLTDLGPDTTASSLNAGGQVLGTLGSQPAVWTAGTWVPLQLPDQLQLVVAEKINRHGVVVGEYSRRPLDRFIAARWTPAGALQPLTADDGVTQANTIDVDDDGTILGQYFNAPLWTWKDGVFTDLPAVDGAELTIAAARNHAGTVLADAYYPDGHWSVMLLQGGAWQSLGTLGGCCAQSRDINRAGHAVGTAYRADGQEHAYVWTGSRMRDLGTFGGPFSEALGINDHDAIVGDAQGNGATIAALWVAGERVKLKGQVVDPIDGWHLQSAVAINNDGVIVGNGFVDLVPHAFLLTPVAP